MDADRKELVHRLFALATEVAEAAHETSVSGQAPTLTPGTLTGLAGMLSRRADDLTTGITASGFATVRADQEPERLRRPSTLQLPAPLHARNKNTKQ